MEADFQEKLKTLLSDPESLGRIMSVASELGLNRQETAQPEPTESRTTPTETASVTPRPMLPTGDPRINLLCSLKPLVREEKRDRLDALTQMLAFASVMKQFRK